MKKGSVDAYPRPPQWNLQNRFTGWHDVDLAVANQGKAGKWISRSAHDEIPDLPENELIGHMISRKWHRHADRRLNLSEYHYDPVEKLEKSRDVSIDFLNGAVRECAVTKRLYANEEFRDLLAESGLEAILCFGAWHGSPFSPESQSQLFTIHKNT